MRSVVVVLPASICAMMPIFLQRSNGTVLGTTNSFWAPEIRCWLLSSWRLAKGQEPMAMSAVHLPPVVRKRLVRFRHAMHIFLLLDGGAASIGGIQQLIAQLVDHPLLAPRPRIGNDPADPQRRAAVGIHLDWHLVVRATDAAGLHFEQRLCVLD